MSEQQYNVGVDGGGTKCRAVIFNADGSPLGVGFGGMANIARVGEHAHTAIIDAVTQALADAGLATSVLPAQCHVHAGLAGANVQSAAAALATWQHPFSSFCFTSDLDAAVAGAHACQNGAAMVIGTGSCAAAYIDGSVIQFGGHGFNLGDKGSGAWLGREAVRYTLEAIDGIVAESPLVATVCQYFNATSAAHLVNALNSALPAEFAKVAPAVLALAADGEKVSKHIVEDGAAYLSAIARKALAKSGGNMVLIGGLADTMQPWLADDVSQRVVPARHSPEWGAILLARSQAD